MPWNWTSSTSSGLWVLGVLTKRTSVPTRASSSISRAWWAYLRAKRSAEWHSTTSTGTCAIRSRSFSSCGRTSVAPEKPSSAKTHSSGTSSPSCSACARSPASWEPIVSCSFCLAEETRAYRAALVMAVTFRTAGSWDTSPSFGDQAQVGGGQLGRAEAIEEILGLGPALGHHRTRRR